MKKLLAWNIFLCIILSTPFVYSQEPAESLIIHAPGPLANAPQHYFGNQNIEFPITISGKAGEFGEIQAQLFQLSSTLEAPYGDPILLNFANLPRELYEYNYRVSLSLPAVEGETLFILRFTASRTINTEQLKLAEIQLVLYPAEILNSLKTWSQKVQLRLKDPKGQLTKLFEAKKIIFQDIQSSVSPDASRPVVNIVVVAAGGHFRREDYIKPGQTTIFFNERESGLPYVRITREGDSRVLEVHMELIQGLDHDPQVQKTLLDIIQLSME